MTLMRIKMSLTQIFYVLGLIVQKMEIIVIKANGDKTYWIN